MTELTGRELDALIAKELGWRIDYRGGWVDPAGIEHWLHQYSSDLADCAALRKHVLKLPEVDYISVKYSRYEVTWYARVHMEDGMYGVVHLKLGLTEEEAIARACYAALVAVREGLGDAVSTAPVTR